MGTTMYLGQGVGRTAEIHDPRVVDFQTTTCNPRVVAVILCTKQVARSEVVDEEFHNASSSLSKWKYKTANN